MTPEKLIEWIQNHPATKPEYKAKFWASWTIGNLAEALFDLGLECSVILKSKEPNL